MYIKRYSTETQYTLIQKYADGSERVLPPDQHDYLEWQAKGNTAAIEAAGRFLSVADGKLLVDPNREKILADEVKAEKEREINQELREIDIASIRFIREWLTAREDAPADLKEQESKAKVLLAALPR